MEEFEVDGFKVMMSPLPGWQGLELGHQLVRMAGPLLGGLAQAAASKDKSALGPAVEGVLRATSPAELTGFLKRLMQSVKVTGPSGKALDFNRAMDAELGGRLSTALKIVGKAVEVNYRDFFSALQSAWGRLRAEHAPAIEAMAEELGESFGFPSKSDGPSGSSSPTGGPPSAS